MPGSADEGRLIGSEVLPRGTPVVTSDGVDVDLRRVHRVLDHEREHSFDGIVVRTGDRRVFIDAPEVARIAERRVTLTIDAAAAAGLPDHRGWRGEVEKRAKRRMDRFKRNLPSR